METRRDGRRTASDAGPSGAHESIPRLILQTRRIDPGEADARLLDSAELTVLTAQEPPHEATVGSIRVPVTFE